MGSIVRVPDKLWAGLGQLSRRAQKEIQLQGVPGCWGNHGRNQNRFALHRVSAHCPDMRRSFPLVSFTTDSVAKREALESLLTIQLVVSAGGIPMFSFNPRK